MACSGAGGVRPPYRPHPRRPGAQSVDTKDPLHKVDALTQKLFKSVQETERHVAKSSAARAQATKQQRADQKTAEAMVEKVNHGAVGQIDTASTHATACLTRLQHEHCALGTALLVCQRRLELREGRPPQELEDKCGLQEAFLNEETMLTNFRESTLVLGGDLMRKIDMATKLRNGVTGQRAQARATMRKNRAEVDREMRGIDPRPRGSPGGGYSASSTPASVTTFASPGSPGVVPASPQMEEAAIHHQTMTGFAQQASELYNEVQDLAKQAESLIAQSQTEAAQANRQVAALLERNAADITELTKKLRSRISDADYALTVAEKMLGRSVKKLDSDDAVAMTKFTASRGAVEELRTTRRDLQESLWRKTVVLNIDEQCRRVTPQWAATRQQRQTQLANKS